jgi:hypothetical protein
MCKKGGIYEIIDYIVELWYDLLVVGHNPKGGEEK